MRPVLNSIGSTISEVGRSIRNTFSTAVKAIGKLADRVTAIVRPTREIHSQHKGPEQRKIGAFRDATIEIPTGTRRSSTVRETAHSTVVHDEGDLASKPSNIASTDSRLTEAEDTHAPAFHDKQKFTPTPFNNVFLRKQILDRVGMTSPASCANLITELAKKHPDASEFREALMASLKKTPKSFLGVDFRYLNDAQQEIVLEIFSSLPIDKVDSIEMRNIVWHDYKRLNAITINPKNTPLIEFLNSKNAIEKLSSFEMSGIYRFVNVANHPPRRQYHQTLFNHLNGLKNLKLDLSYIGEASRTNRDRSPTVLEELNLKIEYTDSFDKAHDISDNILAFPKTRRLIMNIDPQHFFSVPKILEKQTTIVELILKRSDIDAKHKLFSERFKDHNFNVKIQKTSESDLNITFLDSGRNVSVKFQDFQ